MPHKDENGHLLSKFFNSINFHQLYIFVFYVKQESDTKQLYVICVLYHILHGCITSFSGHMNDKITILYTDYRALGYPDKFNILIIETVDNKSIWISGYRLLLNFDILYIFIHHL